MTTEILRGLLLAVLASMALSASTYEVEMEPEKQKPSQLQPDQQASTDVRGMSSDDGLSDLHRLFWNKFTTTTRRPTRRPSYYPPQYPPHYPPHYPYPTYPPPTYRPTYPTYRPTRPPGGGGWPYPGWPGGWPGSGGSGWPGSGGSGWPGQGWTGMPWGWLWNRPDLWVLPEGVSPPWPGWPYTPMPANWTPIPVADQWPGYPWFPPPPGWQPTRRLRSSDTADTNEISQYSPYDYLRYQPNTAEEDGEKNDDMNNKDQMPRQCHKVLPLGIVCV